MPHREQQPPAMGHACADVLLGPRYRALRLLGTGSSGAVYEAIHVELRKRVAVKVLLPAFADDPVSMARMRLEAQALGRLNSQHIVEVFDFGRTDDGRPFFVMPLLAGRTLAEEVRRRGCVPAADAIHLVQQLLSGLEVAHRAGLVHRDIKLDNLFLCDEGDGRRVLKILDFGIAKVLPGASGPELPGLCTSDGDVLGTPRYIPPEQAMGKDVGPRADLYGVGVVLYELLTGRDPFQHVTGLAPLLRAHVSEDAPPPSAVAPQPIEPLLDDIVVRALAKRPQDRYESAADLAGALARARARIGGVATTTAPRALARGPSLRVACALVVASSALSALAAAALTRRP